jgi:alkylation response protein AidB-like acyl-CoA dehydrogenase
MTTVARPDLLSAVDQVAPVILQHAAQAEEEHRIPADSYQAMVDAGLFNMLAPVAHGGLEVHPVEAMAVWEAVGRLDPAHAWNLVMNQAVAGLAAWLSAEGAAEIFQDGPTTLAGALNPPAAATRVDGGWRITGQVPFASGCHNARWFAMPAVEMDGDLPKLDPATGEPAPMAMFFPAEEAEILDTWKTIGMRGTGSTDFKATNLFIPDHRVALVGRLENPAPGFEGPLFRFFPWAAVFGESIVSVAIAASAVEELVELVETKVPAYQQTALRDQQLAQHGAGRARARVEASRDTLYRAAEQAYDQVSGGELLNDDSKIRLQLACSFAAEACVDAVRMVSDVVGTSAIRTTQPFERHVRDVHTLAQHASKSSPRYSTAGRLMFGLENDWIFLTF